MEEYVLTPPHGTQHIEPDQALLRLIKAFGYVRVSSAIGRDYALKARATMPDKLRELGASQAVIDQSIRAHDPDRTYFVYISDDPNRQNRFLRFYLQPETTIDVGFTSEAHFRASRALARRVAKCLGYVCSEG